MECPFASSRSLPGPLMCGGQGLCRRAASARQGDRQPDAGVRRGAIGGAGRDTAWDRRRGREPFGACALRTSRVCPRTGIGAPRVMACTGPVWQGNTGTRRLRVPRQAPGWTIPTCTCRYTAARYFVGANLVFARDRPNARPADLPAGRAPLARGSLAVRCHRAQSRGIPVVPPYRIVRTKLRGRPGCIERLINDGCG